MRRGTVKDRSSRSPKLESRPSRFAGSEPNRNIVSASLLNNERLFTIIVMIWLSIVLYGDIIVFSSAVVECGQRLGISTSSLRHDEAATSLPQVTRVLFVSDPQLTSPYSYPFMQYRLLNWAVSLYSDIYMRKSYVTIQSFLHPEAVFFNGDLFDGVTSTLHEDNGRATFTEDEYSTLYRRWNWVFGAHSKAVAPRWLFNVSGNHDIGWRIDHSLQEKLVKTYETHFGELNYVTRVGNFTFVVLTSGALIPTAHPELAQKTESFITRVDDMDDLELDRILMFHVPLWRPPNQDCGPWNRRGPFYEGRGYSYTNLATERVTDRLLHDIKPKYVFSGDAHDHCQVSHKLGDIPDAVERTLNTFSWLQGNRVPSFGFAVLDNEKRVMKFEYCELPDQLAIYISYGVLAVFTIFVSIVLARNPSDVESEASNSDIDEEAGKRSVDDDQALEHDASFLDMALLKLKTVAILVAATFASAVCWHLLLVWIYL